MAWWQPYEACDERGARVRAELNCGCDYCHMVGDLRAEANRADIVRRATTGRPLHPSPSFSPAWASTITTASGASDADTEEAQSREAASR